MLDTEFHLVVDGWVSRAREREPGRRNVEEDHANGTERLKCMAFRH